MQISSNLGPGIDGADPAGCSGHVDKQETNNPEWLAAKTRGRWAPFWNPQTRTYNPPQTEARKQARRKKYAWSALTMRGGPEYVPLELCMTGDELWAERRRIAGDGSSFRTPRTDEARELVALLPHGKLRTVECLLLVALAYAMLVRRRHGLVATVAELGELVGLRATAVSESMARLIALGFVRADATYTRFGACESQRANLWRLTTQALAAYALRDVPEGVAVPTGTVDRARLQRRRRCTATVQATGSVGSRACTTPRNPETNPDAVTSQENNQESFRNGTRPAVAVPASPAKVSASPTQSIFTVPAAPHLPSQPGRRQDASCSASRRLGTAAGAADVVDELAALVSSPALRDAILRARKDGAS